MRRFVTMVILLTPFHVHAGDCSWYDIACKAAEKVASGMVTSSENIRDAGLKSFNYWGYLLEKYHAGTPAEKEWAGKIIRGSLGINPDAAIQNQFEIAVSFTGIDTRKNEISVAILEDQSSEERIKASILDGARDELIDFRKVGWPVNIAPQSTAVNLEEMRKEIGARLQRNPTLGTSEKCDPVSRSQAADWCRTRVSKKKAADDQFLTDLLMYALDPTTPRGAPAEIRFVWTLGPNITILIPKHQLDSQPNLGMNITIYRVEPDGKRVATPRFANGRTLNHDDLTKGAKIYTSNAKFIDGKNEYYGRRVDIYAP